LFQEYLYGALSGGERRLLHGEIATALEELYGDRAGEIVAHLAHHYAEAGQTEKAIEYALRAGHQARLAYANEEAMAYFHRALMLLNGSPLDRSRKDWRLEALKGLGQVYYGMGKLAEAEECFQEAISLGREIGLAPRELVRLYHWLAEVLWWLDRYDDVIRVGEEGLALLSGHTESVEAALMNDVTAAAHLNKGNVEQWREFTYRTAQFIQRLPYVEELRPAYCHIHLVCSWHKDVEEETKWLQVLERIATRHHDLRALGEIHWYAGNFYLVWTGDLHGAIRRYGEALELLARVGDTKLESNCWQDMGAAFLALGDLQEAELCVSRALDTNVGHKFRIAGSYVQIGLIALCRGHWEEAMDAFQKAVQTFQEINERTGEGHAAYLLGRAYLAQGDRVEALKQFQKAVTLAGPEALKREPSSWFFFYFAWSGLRIIPSAVSGLEEAYEDPEAFRFFCRRFQEERSVEDSAFVQWFLEPADVGAIRESLSHEPPLQYDEFAGSLSPDWTWQDPFGDCSFTVQNGLEIHAANGRDLWHINLSAPRLLRLVSPVLSEVEGGDLAMQTVCVPVLGENPSIGGLLLWKDKENYLRLDRGTTGEHDILFGGCLGNQDVVIGRGRLPLGPSGRVFLRLERVGDRVNALCSADGENWFTVGHVPFPVEDPVQVGLHAIGNIDRSVYHGAYPDGTAIRFEAFQLWGLNR